MIRNREEEKRCIVTIISALLTGLFAHLFGIVNVIKNYDNAYIYKGYGNGISSGRWFLSIIGKGLEKFWGGTWNLQFYNGIVTLVLMAISAYIIIKIFDIKRMIFCVLWAGIFMVFPSVTAIELYVYTAPYYAFAILLAVISVYITLKSKYGFVLGSILGACAIGIYQAYFPIIIGLFVTVLILEALDSKKDLKTILRNGVLYFTTLILIIGLYFLILKILLYGFGIELNTYQGINEMGKINLRELPQMLLDTYFRFLSILKENYIGISATAFVRVMIFGLGILTVFMLGYIITRNRENIIKRNKGILIVLLLIYPIAVNSIILMCYHSLMHTLMVHAMVLIFLMPVLVYMRFEKLLCTRENNHICRVIKMIIVILLTLIIFNYSYQSNGTYTALYYKNQQENNYWNSVITQVKLQKGFNTKLKWAFIGKVEDELYVDPWREMEYYIAGNTGNVLDAYSKDRFILQYHGYRIPFVSEEENEKLMKNEMVKNMANYPNEGSIKIIGDTVIVKFSDIN